MIEKLKHVTTKLSDMKADRTFREWLFAGVTLKIIGWLMWLGEWGEIRREKK